MKDQFNREIDYIRISVTETCNYNCLYCKPEKDLSYIDPNLLTDEEIIKIVEAASNLGVHKVRLTGGEPLMRRGIVNLVKQINEIKGIDEVVMTTNGSVLHKMIDDLKEAGLSRVNISLDSLDPIKFQYITGGGHLEDVLNSIDRLLALDMKPVKVNVVLMKGFNDEEINQFVNLTKEKEVTIRFIELMPIGDHDFPFSEYYLNNDEILKRYPTLNKLDKKPQETAEYYKLPDAKGKIGLISAVSHHFCMACDRIRITSDGKVKPCLHSNTEYDLLQYIRNKEGKIEDFLTTCIINKPKSHKINKKDFEKVKRSMYRIGG